MAEISLEAAINPASLLENWNLFSMVERTTLDKPPTAIPERKVIFSVVNSTFLLYLRFVVVFVVFLSLLSGNKMVEYHICLRYYGFQGDKHLLYKRPVSYPESSGLLVSGGSPYSGVMELTPQESCG